MASIVSSTAFDGPVEPVFDLVTSARLWPRWYPATRAVAGVVERPFRLGDRVREDLESGGVAVRVVWRVAEHERPRHATLQSETSPTRISYFFEQKGDVTEFCRRMDYDPAAMRDRFPDPADVERFLRAHAELALGRLKDLVEGILREEAAVFEWAEGPKPPAARVGAGPHPANPAKASNSASAAAPS